MKTFLLTLFLATQSLCLAQIRIRPIFGYDLYHWYRSPNTVPDSAGRSVGNLLNTFSLGSKLWTGGKQFSVSVEGQISVGLFDLNIGHYNGLGSLAFPLMVRLNFGGLSGFSLKQQRGWNIGGGIQFTKAPLYDIPRNLYHSFDFYPVYIVEFGLGGPLDQSLTPFFLFARFGLNSKNLYAVVAALGIQTHL